MENSQISEKTRGVQNISSSDHVPVFMAGVPSVRPVLDNKRMESVQRRVASMLEWTRSGFPAAVPVPMDQENLKLLSEEEYVVTLKADGTRYLMLIDGQQEIYFLNRNNDVFQVDNLLSFPELKTDSLEMCSHLKGTLVDGEMLRMEDKEGVKYLYLIFDVMTVQGENVIDKNFRERMNIIKEKLLDPRQMYLEIQKPRTTGDPFQFGLQPFWGIEDAEFVYRVYAESLSYSNDGLMFVSAKDPYNFYPATEAPGRCDKKLKWKPPEMNTVDFLLKFGDLYVSDIERPFGRIEMTDELRQLNGSIIECNYKGKDEWSFYRARWDKSIPNTLHTAKTTLESIQNPVSEASLYKFIRNNGFKAD